MRSDNRNESMKLARFMSRKSVIPAVLLIGDAVMFAAFTYLVNVFSDMPLWLSDMEHPISYLGPLQCIPKPLDESRTRLIAYGIFLCIMLISDVITAYKIRMAYSEGFINKGYEGRMRWTTKKEIRRQYKAVPLQPERIQIADGKEIRITNTYKGLPGLVISRQKDRLYIDSAKDSLSNALIYGLTRSGKGEMFVFACIDVYSRPEKMENRPSQIIFDTKGELYKSSKAVLERRGYDVHFFNLASPLDSMGYNPLQLVIDYYKSGQPENAKTAARSFAFAIFHSDDNNIEPIWKDTATDLFVCLIIAVTTDCLAADRELNDERRIVFDREEEERKKRGEEPETFKEIHPNEKKISCYSCINFFKDLFDRAASQQEDEGSFERRAENALDEYFNERARLNRNDYAFQSYQTIKSAGDRMKGSIFTNMQASLSIFNLTDIAQMTAESTVDILDIGYGEKPIAIFMGVPHENKANWFLATTYVAQIYQYLVQAARNADGKLKRNVKFILDEFGNMPPIDNFDQFVTVGLGMGMSFDVYVQSFSQINEKYEKTKTTINNNLATRIFITAGDEGCEEFAKRLGNVTRNDIQRTGHAGSLQKTYMESPKKFQLMPPDELKKLHIGECIIDRQMKRTDKSGAAIVSYPIINEYADTPWLPRRAEEALKIAAKRLIKKEKKTISGEDQEMSFIMEYRRKISDLRKWKGTALLSRYEYMEDTFPSPGKLNMKDICDENRRHIDINETLCDPVEMLEAIKRRNGSNFLGGGFRAGLEERLYEDIQ